MKKTNLIKSILMVACCAFFISACQNDAVADDGTNIRDYSKIDTGSDGSGSGGGGGAAKGLLWFNTFRYCGLLICLLWLDYLPWSVLPLHYLNCL